MNEIIKRAQDIRIKAKQKAIQEIDNVGATNWRGMVLAHDQAVNLVEHALNEMNRFIDRAAKTIDGDSKIQETWCVLANTQLDIAESLITRDTNIEMRIAQLQGLSISMNEQNKNLKKLIGHPPAEVTSILSEVAGCAKAASSFIRDISTDALGYYDITIDLVKGKIINKLSKSSNPSSLLNGEKFIKYLQSKGAKYEHFLKAKQFFSKAAKFLGVLQIGLQITTTVFETLSNQGQWASTLVKGAVAIGSSVILSTFITAPLISSMVTATLVAAGITAEFPPLAAAIIAAGIVIVAGIAIVSLFDSLLDTLFGTEGIPSSMRLSMATQTYTNMSSPMSSSMAASMVSLPH